MKRKLIAELDSDLKLK